MKAVILAGGQGTRLRPLTYTRPKPMVPFLNKPIIDHIVTRLSKQGFEEVIITTNIKESAIEDYFGDGSDWGVKIRLVHEKKRLGTAGSVKNALHHLDETFVVIQGDNISEIDIRKAYEEHRDRDCMATISLITVDDVSQFGIAEMEGDEIVRFKEKPKHEETFSNLANDGIYVLEPEALDMIPLDFYDFSKDLFPRMLKEGKRICGSVTHAFWRDVGKPEDYLEATHHFLHESNLIAEDCDLKESKLVETVLGKGCSVTGAEIRNSVLFEGTSVGVGSKLKSCIVGSECRIGKGVDIWPGAVIGDDVVIEDGATLMGDARIGPRVRVEENDTINRKVLPKDLQ